MGGNIAENKGWGDERIIRLRANRGDLGEKTYHKYLFFLG